MGAVGIEWRDVDYRVAKGTTPKWLGGGRGRSKTTPTAEQGDASAADTPQTEKGPSEGAAALTEFTPSSGHILHHVTGTAAPGQLVAILGPSGAGKSTLVELLAGKEKRGSFSGSIRLIGAGGNPADLASATSTRRLLAFVDQEDQLPSHSTVREALLFAAHLSLPENVQEDEKRGIVQSVITTLGLGAVADSMIGDRGLRGISGGEKRRVSIGIALVGRPRILVLDEPLSGLDAYNAVRVMTALRALASGSSATEPTSPTVASPIAATTVILTLHQPSSQMFHMLDRAILLSGGRTLYDGPPGEAMTWCEEIRDHPCPAGHNVADHLLEIAMRERNSGGGSEDVSGSSSPNDKHAAASSSNAHALLAKHATTTTWFTQVLALSQRYLSTARRDMTGPLAHFVGHVVLAILVGGSFFHVAVTISGFQNRIVSTSALDSHTRNPC